MTPTASMNLNFTGSCKSVVVDLVHRNGSMIWAYRVICAAEYVKIKFLANQSVIA